MYFHLRFNQANNGNKRRNLMRIKILYYEVYLPLHIWVINSFIHSSKLTIIQVNLLCTLFVIASVLQSWNWWKPFLFFLMLLSPKKKSFSFSTNYAGGWKPWLSWLSRHIRFRGTIKSQVRISARESKLWLISTELLLSFIGAFSSG